MALAGTVTGVPEVPLSTIGLDKLEYVRVIASGPGGPSSPSEALHYNPPRRIEITDRGMYIDIEFSR